jgi:5-methylcytosine-specific restriction endonuclease McrA
VIRRLADQTPVANGNAGFQHFWPEVVESGRLAGVPRRGNRVNRKAVAAGRSPGIVAILSAHMPDDSSEKLPIHGGSDTAPKALPRHLQDLIDLLPLNEEVHRSVIERAYGRSNYARRIRKIVAEYGWDIERRRGSNGANDDWYIRRSEGPVRPQNIRYEVPKAKREQVYERDKWTCQMCGANVSGDQTVTRPQCDHKVPAARGGSSEPENLQTLCTRCNLKKRQACELCQLPSCDSCPYAYPEQYDSVQVVALSQIAADNLAKYARSNGVPPATIIRRLLEEL